MRTEPWSSSPSTASSCSTWPDRSRSCGRRRCSAPTPAYRTLIATPDGPPVRSESGVDRQRRRLARRARPRAGGAIDTLVVVGGVGTRAATRDAVVPRRPRGRRRGAPGVPPRCAPAPSLLAAAGLLDGYEATTHWASCDRLAERHPQVAVHADRIYVHDRDRWTSAGVTAGIDLFLALVEDDHGAELAHAVAGWLVVFVRRPGGQSQFSAQLRAEPAALPAIAELQRWLPDHLDEDLGRRGARGARRHEPAQLRRVLPPRDRHDAGGLRRGAAGRGRPPAARDDRPHRRRRRRARRHRGTPRPSTARSAGGRHHPDRYRQHFGRGRRPRARRRTGAACRSPSASTPGSPPSTPSARTRCSPTSPAPTSCSAPSGPGASTTTTACCTSTSSTPSPTSPRPTSCSCPGGLVTRKWRRGRADRRLDPRGPRHTTYTTSVCTGALLLGAAGVLDGLRATTHWIAYDQLRSYGAEPTEQRVVFEGKVVDRRRRVGRHRPRAHAGRRAPRPRGRPGHPARHRVRPAAALRRRRAVEGRRRDPRARRRRHAGRRGEALLPIPTVIAPR